MKLSNNLINEKNNDNVSMSANLQCDCGSNLFKIYHTGSQKKKSIYKKNNQITIKAKCSKCNKEFELYKCNNKKEYEYSELKINDDNLFMIQMSYNFEKEFYKTDNYEMIFIDIKSKNSNKYTCIFEADNIKKQKSEKGKLEDNFLKKIIIMFTIMFIFSIIRNNMIEKWKIYQLLDIVVDIILSLIFLLLYRRNANSFFYRGSSYLFKKIGYLFFKALLIFVIFMTFISSIISIFDIMQKPKSIYLYNIKFEYSGRYSTLVGYDKNDKKYELFFRDGLLDENKIKKNKIKVYYYSNEHRIYKIKYE